jgi:uncharacterized membrane protein
VELGEPVLGAEVPAAIIAPEGEVVILAATVTLNHDPSFSVLGILADTHI